MLVPSWDILNRQRNQVNLSLAIRLKPSERLMPTTRIPFSLRFTSYAFHNETSTGKTPSMSAGFARGH